MKNSNMQFLHITFHCYDGQIKIRLVYLITDRYHAVFFIK